MVEGSSLENCQGSKALRGFESHPLRGGIFGAMTAARLFAGIAATLVVGASAACHSGSTGPNQQSETIQVLITPSSVALAPGKTVQLKATVTGPPGIEQSVVWTSLNPDIASITGAGLVTALTEGSATIRAAWFPDQQEFSTIVVLVTTTAVDSTASSPQGSAPARLPVFPSARLPWRLLVFPSSR